MYGILTVHVHSNGLDGGGSKPVLSFAVVATSLGPQDLGDVQRLVEHAGVLETVRHAAGGLGPSDLDRSRGSGMTTPSKATSSVSVVAHE